MLALARYLFEQTDAPRATTDILQEYRNWLDANGIPAETEHGWATSNAFGEAVLSRFLETWR